MDEFPNDNDFESFFSSSFHSNSNSISTTTTPSSSSSTNASSTSPISSIPTFSSTDNSSSIFPPTTSPPTIITTSSSSPSLQPTITSSPSSSSLQLQPTLQRCTSTTSSSSSSLQPLVTSTTSSLDRKRRIFYILSSCFSPLIRSGFTFQKRIEEVFPRLHVLCAIIAKYLAIKAPDGQVVGLTIDLLQIMDSIRFSTSNKAAFLGQIRQYVYNTLLQFEVTRSTAAAAACFTSNEALNAYLMNTVSGLLEQLNYVQRADVQDASAADESTNDLITQFATDVAIKAYSGNSTMVWFQNRSIFKQITSQAQQFPTITQFSGVTALHIVGTKDTQAELFTLSNHLVRCTALQELVLMGTFDMSIVMILINSTNRWSQLRKLYLDVEFQPFYNHQLAINFIPLPPSLEELNVQEHRGKYLKDGDIAEFLEQLLEACAPCVNLSSLSIGGISISLRASEAIGAMKSLQELGLDFSIPVHYNLRFNQLRELTHLHTYRVNPPPAVLRILNHCNVATKLRDTQLNVAHAVFDQCMCIEQQLEQRPWSLITDIVLRQLPHVRRLHLFHHPSVNMSVEAMMTFIGAAALDHLSVTMLGAPIAAASSEFLTDLAKLIGARKFEPRVSVGGVHDVPLFAPSKPPAVGASTASAATDSTTASRASTTIAPVPLLMPKLSSVTPVFNISATVRNTRVISFPMFQQPSVNLSQPPIQIVEEELAAGTLKRSRGIDDELSATVEQEAKRLKLSSASSSSSSIAENTALSALPSDTTPRVPQYKAPRKLSLEGVFPMKLLDHFFTHSEFSWFMSTEELEINTPWLQNYDLTSGSAQQRFSPTSMLACNNASLHQSLVAFLRSNPSLRKLAVSCPLSPTEIYALANAAAQCSVLESIKPNLDSYSTEDVEALRVYLQSGDGALVKKVDLSTDTTTKQSSPRALSNGLCQSAFLGTYFSSPYANKQVELTQFQLLFLAAELKLLSRASGHVTEEEEESKWPPEPNGSIWSVIKDILMKQTLWTPFESCMFN